MTREEAIAMIENDKRIHHDFLSGKYRQALTMAIEALKERPKGEWIPCSDRLPEEEGHYIVYAPSYRGGSSSGKEMHNGVMFSRFKNGKWSIEVGYHKRPGCVKAWMPLPAPWKGENDD